MRAPSVTGGSEARPRPRTPLARRLARFNRRWANPFILKFAGSFGPLVVVRHRGRRTGRSHSTPVLAFATDDGLLIGVLYGTTSDWVRNVLTAGEVEVRRHRRTRHYDEPRLVGSQEGLRLVPFIVRWPFRLLGVRRFLQVNDSGRDDRPGTTSHDRDGAGTPRDGSQP